MEDANNIELVFVPAPAMGHLVPAMGTAKLLLQRRPQLSITVLIMKMPLSPDAKINSYIDSLIADEKDINPRLKLILLPEDLNALKGYTDRVSFFHAFLDSQKTRVRDYCVNEFHKSSSARRLAGFVVDVFCTDFIMDVGEEFGSLKDDHGIDASAFKDSDPDLNIPTYFNPFPVKLLPNLPFFDLSTRIREAKGVIVNTFFDLEQHAIESLSNNKRFPPVYPVGPILNLIPHHQEKKNNQESEEKQIFKWLDDHPASSVVFLCFGSGGTFPESQVKEIAYALERSGQRFLWALRKPPCPGSVLPTEYSNPEEVLPKGFLERTKSIGKIIGWAPQSAVLAHPAVGSFVSHCGWNSTLESIWFGVPIATWPMSVDQQANAFQLVREIGTAVDIKMDYRVDSRDPKINSPIIPEIVNTKEIEIGITSLMNEYSTPNSVRTKAKEVQEKSRKALEEGGSSFNFVECFFENVMNNLK
nr:anthocyanidin 3-O-glucosyltransferase 2-like [Ipomoea batatas]